MFTWFMKCLLVYTSFHFNPIITSDEVASLNVAISSNYTNTSSIRIFLWFDSIIYQYAFNSSQDLPTNISNPMMTIYDISRCNNTINTSNVSKILIQNDNPSTIVIHKLNFITISGEWYGIRGHQPNDTNICVSNQQCKPSKQIMYFDLNRPQIYIQNATRSDGTSVDINAITCAEYPPSMLPTVDTVDDNIIDILLDQYNSYKLYVTTIAINIIICVCFGCFLCCVVKKYRKKHNKIGEKSVEFRPKKSKKKKKLPAKQEPPVKSVKHEGLLCRWLEYKVELPQYKDHFLKNGYKTIKSVFRIRRKAQLSAIGIRIPGHQTLLLSEIKKLRAIAQKRRDKMHNEQPPEVKEEPVPQLNLEHEINTVWADYAQDIAEFINQTMGKYVADNEEQILRDDVRVSHITPARVASHSFDEEIACRSPTRNDEFVVHGDDDEDTDDGEDINDTDNDDNEVANETETVHTKN